MVMVAGLSGETPSDCSAALTFFASASASCLLFGSSNSAGTAAIRLEGDLKTVYLGPSDTYNNPPLVDPTEKGDVSSGAGTGPGPFGFPIKEMEVFCGSRSVMTSGDWRLALDSSIYSFCDRNVCTCVSVSR